LFLFKVLANNSPRLPAGAVGRAGLLIHQSHDRLVIRLRVIEAVQQMNRARSGGRLAEPDAPGELCMRGGHERSRRP